MDMNDLFQYLHAILAYFGTLSIRVEVTEGMEHYVTSLPNSVDPLPPPMAKRGVQGPLERLADLAD